MPRVCRLAAAAAVAVLAVVMSAGPALAGGGPPVGPVQINAIGHPGLCWQAGGNGSAITLERCDPALADQQWSLTGAGVVMNGNGYCLEARTGQPASRSPAAPDGPAWSAP